jgi:hypothetical protein
MAWLRTRFRLERWQLILASAVVGAAVAILAVETVSLLGDLLDQGWLRDVGNNVDGSTASAGGAAAGAGAAAGGPATRGGGTPAPPVSDPHGRDDAPRGQAERNSVGEIVDPGVWTQQDRQQEQQRRMDEARRRQASATPLSSDVAAPTPTPRGATLGEIYRRR